MDKENVINLSYLPSSCRDLSFKQIADLFKQLPYMGLDEAAQIKVRKVCPFQQSSFSSLISRIADPVLCV